MKLWRLESFTPHAVEHPQTLAAGLHLHLAQTALMTVEMRVGEQTRAYLGLASCSGCESGRCIPGCHSDLFRRVVRASAPTVTYAPLGGGLARRSYVRGCLARPRPDAESLCLPDTGSEARLSIVYHKRSAVVLLLVGPDGPDPVAYVRAAHWQAWPLPTPLLKWAAAPMPPTPSVAGGVLGAPLFFTVPLGAYPAAARRVPKARPVLNRQKRDKDVLVAVSAPERDVPHVLAPPVLPDEPPALLARLIALALRPPQTDGGAVVGSTHSLVSAGVPTQFDEHDDTADGSGLWPAGPDGMLPGHVEHVVTALLHNGEVREKGVTRKVLKGLAPTQEMALFVWFDSAGLFEEPTNITDPAQRWRERRRLSSNDAQEIAERLSKTVHPNMDRVVIATRLLGG